jgi:predicted membrane protein
MISHDNINNVFLLISLIITLITVLILIYYRYKYTINKKWIGLCIFFDILINIYIYKFPNMIIEALSISATLSLCIIVAILSPEFSELNNTNNTNNYIHNINNENEIHLSVTSDISDIENQFTLVH